MGESPNELEKFLKLHEKYGATINNDILSVPLPCLGPYNICRSRAFHPGTGWSKIRRLKAWVQIAKSLSAEDAKAPGQDRRFINWRKSLLGIRICTGVLPRWICVFHLLVCLEYLKDRCKVSRRRESLPEIQEGTGEVGADKSRKPSRKHLIRHFCYTNGSRMPPGCIMKVNTQRRNNLYWRRWLISCSRLFQRQQK